MENVKATMQAAWLHIPGLALFAGVDWTWAVAWTVAFAIGAVWGFARNRKTFTLITLLQ